MINIALEFFFTMNTAHTTVTLLTTPLPGAASDTVPGEHFPEWSWPQYGLPFAKPCLQLLTGSLPQESAQGGGLGGIMMVNQQIWNPT